MSRKLAPLLVIATTCLACGDDAGATASGGGNTGATSAGGGDGGDGGDTGAGGDASPTGTGGTTDTASSGATGQTAGSSGAGGDGSGGSLVVPPSVFDVEALDHHRNRLLDTLAQRRGESDRCTFWTAMTTVEKGLFITHTDMLGHRSCFDNASVPVDQMNGDSCDAGECTCDTGDPCRCEAGAMQAVDHVFKVWGLNGTDLTCCTEDDCCNGGAEWHRTFFSADDHLIASFRNVHSALPEWADSDDFAGPHEPFDQSSETQRGSPRGQTHFWSLDGSAQVLQRTGVEGVLDPHIVEMDNDYNILHDSNSEGTYSSQYGRAKFKDNWNGQEDDNRGDGLPTTFFGNGAPPGISEIANDEEWLPSCGPRITVGGVTGPGGAPDAIELNDSVTIAGTGFAASGNRVFVRTRSMAIVIDGASPLLLAESEDAIEIFLPPDLGSGEAFVIVESLGTLTNVEPVTIAP